MTCDELEQSCVQRKQQNLFAALLDSIQLDVNELAASDVDEKQSGHTSFDTDQQSNWSNSNTHNQEEEQCES
jgi:hypothetical protein